LRTLFSSQTPQTQMTAIASDAGLSGPIEVDSGSKEPISTPETTKITSSPSSTGTSEPTR